MFPVKKKRHLATLQLAPMIDIFVLLIVFLVKGTAMGGVTVNIPPGLTAASSISPEDLEVAPEVYLFKEKVEFKMINKTVALNLFEIVNEPAELQNIREEIKKFYEKLPVSAKKSGNLVNFIADSEANYDRIFQVVKFLRQSSVSSVLFIAEGETKQ